MAFLSARQYRFIFEYMVDLDHVEAAKRAGYDAQYGRILLDNPQVRARLQKAMQDQAGRAEVEADFVVRQLFDIASVDIGEVFEPDGSMRPLDQIPENVRQAISGIEVDELFEGHGKDRERVGYTKKVKLNDKMRALELLGKRLAMWKDRIEVSADASLVDALKAARARAEASDLV